MTVGEKIQFYRKKSGLSQEELGQKMFVSRQTISLWEMDKTLPTIDNLLLLKEIFSISIDEILSESSVVEQEKEKPKESYVFQYEKSELKDIFKHSIYPFVKRAVVFVILCVIILAFVALTDDYGTVIGIVSGFFLCGIIGYIKGFFNYKKSWNNAENKILESAYHYDIYDNYFVLNISKNDEIKKTLKVYYEEIEKIESFGKYMFLYVDGQRYIIKKDSLSKNSQFHSFCHINTEKVEVKNMKDSLKIVSILLFIFSIATIWGALACTAIVTAINFSFSENMWIFFLFTPIPIASLIFGFYLKKKGYKYKKNIVVGIVMTTLLCIYGSFTFIFFNAYSHSEEPILKIEEMLSIDIPEHSQINTKDWTKGTQTSPRGYIFSTSDIYFKKDAVKEFEEKLPSDSKWLNTIPNDIIGITSYLCDFQEYDYFILYNTQTKEFNQLPSESGKYRFINIMYSTDSNTMTLVEYEIEYIK